MPDFRDLPSPTIFTGNWNEWLFRVYDRLGGNRNNILFVPSFTVATLPPATLAGGIIYVSNEVGGAVLAFSDGTNWRRVTDRAIVS